MSKVFNIGDKVFAKVRGYPAWPARIENVVNVSSNKRKYNVIFYGTFQSAVCKVEDIHDYHESKEKFAKPLKRRGFLEALMQIEEKLKNEESKKEDSENSDVEDKLVIDEDSNTNLKPPEVKKRGIKRKRDNVSNNVDDKSANDSGSRTITHNPVVSLKRLKNFPRKQPPNGTSFNSVSSDSKTCSSPLTPETNPRSIRTPVISIKRLKKIPQMEINGISSSSTSDSSAHSSQIKPEIVSRSGRKIKPKKFADEVFNCSSQSVDSPSVDSSSVDSSSVDSPSVDSPSVDSPRADTSRANAPRVDAARTNASRANALRANASRANAPRANAPRANASRANAPKSNAPRANASRANASRANALRANVPRAVATKAHASSLDAPSKNVPSADAPSIDASRVTPDAIQKAHTEVNDKVIPEEKQAGSSKEGTEKQIRITVRTPAELNEPVPSCSTSTGNNVGTHRLPERDKAIIRDKLTCLRIEARMLELENKVKANLGIKKANTSMSVVLLEELCNLNIQPLMLKKHPGVLKTIKKLRRYVGNTSDWKLSESEERAFQADASQIRNKCNSLYSKIREIFDVPDGQALWTVFSEQVKEFKRKTRSLDVEKICALTIDPTVTSESEDNLPNSEQQQNVTGQQDQTEPQAEVAVPQSSQLLVTIKTEPLDIDEDSANPSTCEASTSFENSKVKIEAESDEDSPPHCTVKIEMEESSE